MPHQPVPLPSHPRRLRPLLAALLLLPLGCGGGTAGEGDAAPPPRGAGAEALRPRIAAEHPVTSPPAREAGLLEDDGLGRALDGALDDGALDGALDGGALDGGGDEAGPGRTVLVLLPATDLEESVDFYRGLLALEVAATDPAEPPFRRVELTPPSPPGRRPALRLVLVEAAELAARPWPTPAGGGGEEEGSGDGHGGSGGETDGGSAAGAVPAWPVADLAAVARRLEEAGVATMERSVTPGRSALAVVDPAGNPILLLGPGGL